MESSRSLLLVVVRTIGTHSPDKQHGCSQVCKRAYSLALQALEIPGVEIAGRLSGTLVRGVAKLRRGQSQHFTSRAKRRGRSSTGISRASGCRSCPANSKPRLWFCGGPRAATSRTQARAATSAHVRSRGTDRQCAADLGTMHLRLDGPLTRRLAGGVLRALTDGPYPSPSWCRGAHGEHPYSPDRPRRGTLVRERTSDR